MITGSETISCEEQHDETPIRISVKDFDVPYKDCLCWFVFNYKVVSNLRDKIPTDLAVFNMRNTSPVRCVQRCALNKNCLSVSLTSNSICQGYSKVYGINSSSLITHTGTRLHAWRKTGIALP